MAALIDKYEAERIPPRHDTQRTYRSFLENHIRPRWGDYLIEDVEPREVELWLRNLDRAPKTRGHLRSLLHTLFEFAMWARMLPIGRNPMELVVVRGVSKRLRKQRSLTVEQFHKLLDQLCEPFATICLVCICLGLRISEALGLRWSDIDWLASTITIERSIVERHVDTPKTENSAEKMILSKELISRIQLWRQQTQFPAEGDWIFASPVKIGRLPYSYTGVWRRLQQAAAKAGMDKLGTHAFRHSYRSWLDMVGTPLAVQKKAMRHGDITTTMKYGEIVDDRVDQALEKVSGLVFANSTQTARSAS